MASQFPDIILLVDGVPTPNGGGTSQTLANLFDQWTGRFYYLSASSEDQSGYSKRMPVQMLYYRVRRVSSMSNRLGLLLNGWLQRRQLNWMEQTPLPLAELPLPNQSLVFLSTNLPYKLIIAKRLQQQGYTVIPYFMDDWMAGNHLQWKGHNLQQLVQQLLQQAPAWLMISRQLEQTLRHRYNLLPKPTLIIHNPAPEIQLIDDSWQLAGADETDFSHQLSTTNHQLPSSHQPSTTNRQLSSSHQPPTTNHQLSSSYQPSTTNHQLIYAGSIWPMHADALIAVAQAIHQLQAQGHTSYQLTIYTSEAHWAQYRLQLTGPGVQYGGWKPYHDIHAPLQQAWLLVCTASFAAAHQAYSRSSVQTKLTDYMACGKPILFVGPADAASGLFVEDYDLGFTLATHVPADIAERLLAMARMPEQYYRKQLNTLHEARTRFSKAAVQQELYGFLVQYGRSSC